jgi:ABC-type Mn2+/Zn2+ transport system permease subunit
MYRLLIEPFSSPLMARALMAGVLAVLTCSVVGTWVVIRGLSFMGDALAHAVLPGIAVAYLLGIDPLIGAFASAAVTVVGINLASRRGRVSEDTGIGLLFVGMLALGVIIISSSDRFTTDLNDFLFGDVLGVRVDDLYVQAVALVVVLVATVVLYRPFLALSFNVDKAASLGLRPERAAAVMLLLVALAIVSSFKAVGSLLVFGLLVAPPATATLLVRRVPVIMAVGAAIGVVCVWAGLLISYHHETAAGATMSGLAVAVFFVVLGSREVGAWSARIGRREPATA